jgi:hypothetical protein
MESITSLTDQIEILFDKKPDGRKRDLFKKWKEEINILIEAVNKLSKIKLYSKQ